MRRLLCCALERGERMIWQVFWGGQPKITTFYMRGFIYTKRRSCTEKLSHAPSEKTSCDEEASGQEQKPQHAHSACDIRTVCDPP